MTTFWMRASTMPRRLADRVVLLGFDGAAPNLLEPLIAAGQLPHLRGLMERGAYGALQTFRPVKSDILWTTIATGKTMAKHGIVDWTAVDDQGRERPLKGTARRVRTYWEILDERGLTTTTLNWWLSQPPSPLRHGVLVSDAYRDSTEPGTVHPAGLFPMLRGTRPRPRDVAKEWGPLRLTDYTVESVKVPIRGIAVQTLGAHRGYLLGDLVVDRASDALWNAPRAEVFSTYFRFVDVTSHFGLHFVEPSAYEAADRADRAGNLTGPARALIDGAMARAVLPAYALMDRIVGKYLERIDDERTLLVVCSDHGFAWDKGVFDHTHHGQAPPPGILLLAGPGVRPGARLEGASLLDIAPSLLYALGQPVAQDMDGQVLADAFEPRWRERFPVRMVRTYETGKRAEGDARPSEELDERRLEDLRALGYLGGSER